MSPSFVPKAPGAPFGQRTTLRAKPVGGLTADAGGTAAATSNSMPKTARLSPASPAKTAEICLIARQNTRKRAQTAAIVAASTPSGQGALPTLTDVRTY